MFTSPASQSLPAMPPPLLSRLAVSQFAKLLIAHIAKRPSGSLAYSRQLSLRQCGSSGRYQDKIIKPHLTSCRAAIARSHFHVSCRCGNVDSLGRYRHFRLLSSLSGRYQAGVARSLPTTSADALYLDAATVVAHLMLTLVATKFYYASVSSAHQHPPHGRYQV